MYINKKFTLHLKSILSDVHNSIINRRQKLEAIQRPLTDKLITEMLSHIMKHYSVTKSSEVLIHATIWINLKNIPSERSRSQKITHGVLPLTQNVQNRHTCGGRT